MEWNGEHRNRPCTYSQLIFEKAIFPTKCTGTAGHLHAKSNDLNTDLTSFMKKRIRDQNIKLKPIKIPEDNIEKSS